MKIQVDLILNIIEKLGFQINGNIINYFVDVKKQGMKLDGVNFPILVIPYIMLEYYLNFNGKEFRIIEADHLNNASIFHYLNEQELSKTPNLLIEMVKKTFELENERFKKDQKTETCDNTCIACDGKGKDGNGNTCRACMGSDEVDIKWKN